MRIPIILLALMLPAQAFACDDIQRLLRQAYPRATAIADGLLVTGSYVRHIAAADVACKAWPARPDLLLLAVPLIEHEPATEDESRGDVEVIVADTKTGQPVARRLEEGMAFGDAFRFTGVALDTARYDIRPGQRAFGVITAQEGSSRVNPFSESALWLYELSGGRLARVLDGLVVRRLNGENDGNCEGHTIEIKRTVALAAAEHHGYRDLSVAQTEVTSTSAKAGDGCEWIDKDGAATQSTLGFDGERYRLLDPPGGDDWLSSIEITNAP